MLDKKKFLDLYNDVFDEEGKIKAVGRERTKALIAFCKEFSPNCDFGSLTTGFMNVENIYKLYEKVQAMEG